MAAPAPSSGSVPQAPGFPPQAGSTSHSQVAPPAVPEMTGLDQKAFPVQAEPNLARHLFSFADPVVKPISNLLASLQASREKLNLPNPGTVENLQKEVKFTHLNGYVFDGGRADLTKAISMNPIFQVTHGLSTGQSEGKPTYNFGAVYGTDRSFLQGNVDDSGSVIVRANRKLFPGHTAKMQAQLASASKGQSFAQFEHDYQGTDHSFNFKTLSPNPNDGSGIYMLNFLQSLTPNLALGIETVYNRQSVDKPEASTGYVAKWTSDARDSIATLQLQGMGVAQATYWQRLAERVDAAVDLQAITAGGRRDAQATVGVKWDFRASTLRAQVDSTRKVSSVFEHRLAPTFAFTVAGEVDHLKGGAAKFGVGVSIESASSDMPLDPNAPPPAPPSVPM